MEIKTEEISVLNNLSDFQKENFAKKIVENFKKWDDDRAEQITTAQLLQDELYLKQPRRFVDKKRKWKSDIKLNTLYNIKKTLKSMLWREVYPNAESMFNVRGTNEQTEKMAKQQKASIVDSLNKMKIGHQYDIAVDSLLDIGEMVAKVDWISKRKIVKRQRKGIGWVFENIVSLVNGAGFQTSSSLQDVEIPTYENARVETISPYMFVFDHSKFKLYDEDSWNSLTKIYKRFDTLGNIKANKVYDVKQEWLDELIKSKNKTPDNEELIDMRDLTQYGEQYPILLAHGDFEINGQVYKNYIAEILADKYLIRFEENPMFINPFVYCALEYDPTNKRGIPLLKAVYDMCIEEENLTNVAFDVQKLTANPVLLAQKGVFEDIVDDDGLLYYEPGKVIEFENGIAQNQPIPMTVSASGISDLLSLLNQKISNVSNVSNIMFGNIEKEDRTATELNLVDKGSSNQVGKILDIFNQDFTLEIVKKVAELLAIFKNSNDYVYTKEKGLNIQYKITNEIRQAQYEYVYEDRNALNDYKSKVELFYKLCQGAFQLPQLAQQLDAKKIFVTIVETLGFDNVDTFFKPDNSTTQFTEELNNLPSNIQDEVTQVLQRQLQQMMQQYQQNREQQEMQAQAQKQVQMQAFRDNARAELEAQQMNDYMGAV